MWTSALGGGEVRYHEDLPSCCQREARGSDDSFECVSCGAMWQAADAPESVECAFGVAEERSHRGAA